MLSTSGSFLLESAVTRQVVMASVSADRESTRTHNPPAWPHTFIQVANCAWPRLVRGAREGLPRGDAASH